MNNNVRRNHVIHSAYLLLTAVNNCFLLFTAVNNILHDTQNKMTLTDHLY